MLLKSILFFSVKSIKIISKDAQIENLIQKEFGLKASQEGPFDLIYQHSSSVDVLSLHREDIHNDSLILIENIHENEKTGGLWKTLKQNEMITVSIDMFYCGLLCIREEQGKEHFKIRI